MNDLHARIIESARQWSSTDPNTTTSKYVKDLLQRCKDNDEKTIEEIASIFPSDVTKRISFGTAGLRAAMQPGPLSMNDLTIVQTAQGLAKYCQKKKKSSDSGKKLRVVVGYDHRCNPTLELSSVSFAIITALVFSEAGIDCLLLDGFVLTPLVPFSVKEMGAIAGVMITASHNPKQDNGYKVYASDSCQIRAPMDKEIAEEINDNLVPWIDYGAKIESLKKEHQVDPCLGLSDPDATKNMLNKYCKSILDIGLKTGQAKIEERIPDVSLDPPTFAYTAMHGIGYKFARRVFEEFDLPAFQAVPQQRDPDYEFPTADFPNPEEKGAMDLAKQFAIDNNCDIVLANDPDADRLAVAERDRSSREWSVFTGDQIGTMLGLWIWEMIGKNCGKPVSMCGSTVSSKMLAEIARVEGFKFEDTLTGFKWIGSRATELQSSGYRNLFGYEEAIGFACGDVIFDKDGISALAVFSELSLWVYRHGKNLKQHMQSLYDKYGEFVSYNGYFIMNDASVVPGIMERIRCGGAYDMDLSPYKVNYVRDLGDPGYDSSKDDKKPILPISKSSPMMTLGFTNGCVAQFRASGTEPKFKYYIEMKGKPGVARDVVEKDLNEMASFMLEKLLEPEKNGLKSKL